MKKLSIGFTDTHEHLATFFIFLLSTRYDLEIVDTKKETPKILLFGDDNFGKRNLDFSRKDCVKLFYTGENRRPENFDCDYAISFDHPSKSTVFVATELGTIQKIRNDKWRIFDFLWMLHTMDYQGRDNFGNILLRGFSIFGLFTIFSGFILFYLSSVKRKKTHTTPIKVQ